MPPWHEQASCLAQSQAAGMEPLGTIQLHHSSTPLCPATKACVIFSNWVLPYSSGVHVLAEKTASTVWGALWDLPDHSSGIEHFMQPH